MSATQENMTQHSEQSTNWSESSESQETVANETQYELWTTQVQVETQQSAQQLKQDVSRESFCNYMRDKWTPMESQSQAIQDLTQQILWPSEDSQLTKENKKYNQIKQELNEGLKEKNVKKITSSVKKLLKQFLNKFFKRKINIWNDINYTPDENDKEYIINAISATLDSEKRSNLTYLLWKIKDEENKNKLKDKWIDNPSQFQLFLQNCKPWQLILTNAESTWAKRHATFSKATQIVSGSRWCHAAVISGVKEENWVVVDATLVQSTWTGIEEISLKECFQEKYKNSDLLLWTFQPPEKWRDVVNHCKNYIWNKYSQINLVADTIFDSTYRGKKKFKKQEKNKYCSELVFTWMQEAGLKLPDPHVTPADLLSTSAVIPEYCCYCDNFS